VRRRSLLAGGAGVLASAFAACGSPTPTASPAPVASPTPSTPSLATPSATATPSPTRPPPPPGPLGGVGTWRGAPDASQALADSGARWFYTWAPEHPEIKAPEGCEFVPMIQDER